ncbi:MAG: 3-oxoacyl-ACP reductase [Tistrella sp.]|uniref:3-oxoacyl-ACP reductase n=1 Tax=Tistrella mobilis TaxID=171437 RepID=A0A3B9IM36_9PROT|nr:glucose 1-dehydrogenase [Tistrella sp.]MAD35886.1 3-oxoacyl-ACP reductase [Tistrella sp.]MBA74540.1 3-oxoacyl-ACP reductase [Tistrella sp.]HAE48377.1 3-oxoacyl-ACP reductase [Tistrella mobilis]
MTKRLENKTALVFGAGSSGPGWGNGKATAVLFAREGARVVCVDRVAEAAEETAGIIRDEGFEAIAVTADVTSSAEIAAAVAKTVETFGRLDVLHNNVGITEMGGPVELDEARWRRAIDVNATSVFLACKHAIPEMLKAGGGAIVNVSSLAAIRWTNYPYLAYYAAKAAVNQMTVAIALEYAKQGIRCNAIMPGMMDTPLIRTQIVGQYADAEDMIAKRHAACPTGRMGDGWDIAKAAVFLASDDAGYITGHCLPVDGGLSCRAA